MRGIAVIIRRVNGGGTSSWGSSLRETLMMSSLATISYFSSPSSSYVAFSDNNPPKTFFNSTTTHYTTDKFQSLHYFNPTHNFSTSSSSGPSNIVTIESEEQFNSSLSKAKDESLPAIFYFTAVWCGPCRLLSPIVSQLSEKYPHVTTYKIDIDQEGLEGALSNLKIHSVPTIYMFQNGKKTFEVIGADVQRLKDAMEQLYK